MKFTKYFGAIILASIAGYGGTLTSVTSIPGATIVYCTGGGSAGGGITISSGPASCYSGDWILGNGGSATFTFSTPVTSFGAIMETRVVFTATSSLDGTQNGSLSMIFTSGDFFGVTNTTPFDSVTINFPNDSTIVATDFQFIAAPVSQTPEPSTLALIAPLCVGLLGFIVYRSRQKCVE